MSTQDPNPSSQDPYGTPQAPQYGQPQQGGYPAAPAYSGEQGLQNGSPKNGLGLAALIIGIVSLLISWVPFAGFVGIVAVVLGIIGLRRVKARVATNKGMALAGLILGALAVVAGILWIVAIAFFANTVSDCNDVINDQVAYEQCVTDQLS